MVLLNFISVFFVALFISPCVSGQETIICSTTDISDTEHNYGFVWKINGFRAFMSENTTFSLSRTNLTFKSDEPELDETYWDFQLKINRNSITLIAIHHPQPSAMGGNGFDRKENIRVTHHISPVIMAKDIANNLEVVDSISLRQYMLKQTKQPNIGFQNIGFQNFGIPNIGTPNKMLPQYNVWKPWRDMYSNSSSVLSGSPWVSYYYWRNILPTVNQTFTDAGDDVNDLTVKFQIKINVLKSSFVDNDC